MDQDTKNNQEALKTFKCPNCEFAPTSQSSLKSHISAIHENKKPHKCDKCDFSTARKHYLKIHIENMHEKAPLQFNCPKCPFTTNIKTKLNAHTASVLIAVTLPQLINII